MLDIIEYLFASFWHWAGFTVWLTIVGQAVATVFGGTIIFIDR